jgi:putative AbiEii toxin of type IV toxin-antitoxin system/OLD-like protein
MLQIIADDPEVLLIDEPEAFLHPALSFLLGREIARATAASQKRLFASTHSSSFLMGCIQSGAPLTVIRFTYRNDIATARALPSNELFKLVRNPLLRSTGVLAGLFYEYVIVTESDADRAFYQEVNERLLAKSPAEGIPNCLFINAQNKQTVGTIIRPLRELGIPAAAIVDIDVLKDGGTTWSTFVGSMFLPEVEHHAIAQLRGDLMKRFNASGKDMKRDGGTQVLADTDREAAENLLEKLAKYGAFVVPGGELESWLKPLGASGHGPQWLVNIFEKLGEDPTSNAYVNAGSGDVWQFVAGVKSWFSDANRKGIPA